ncbi:TPA: hypothetical protein JF854_001498 [Enterobacter hormaechei subsp. steigerwaltii]|uniref:hypothetical protein n=1 Tax=Enterobacter cloacae complex TaxID=354276 RepID=UPI00079A993E|nr:MULTISPECIES: hypothetical protein [Enterobacter cloacae complex]HAS0712527.1 hypothetical protein [Enterobacter hormaechei subsp. steigerwaltii]SAH98817.1 Uncharacterised protein [Enterobacter cloacae]HAS0890275.1 hypothetical protein [Enterobacter hormaechei subsp. steigerwaltii]HAS0898910.1 hypothetical protein [Enterobacter hormaechei subsp. steigerwaltii]HAT7679701.1 hypothetical protein [Enterobacter hormaechei subsp. steigerwaltii]
MTDKQFIELLKHENATLMLKLKQKEHDYDQLEKTYRVTHELLEKTLQNNIKENQNASL